MDSRWAGRCGCRRFSTAGTSCSSWGITNRSGSAGSTTGLFSLAPAAFQGGDFSTLASKIYDPDSRSRGADGTLTGTAFPGNVIPANRISATSKKLLEFYNTPTLPGVTNNFVQALARPQNRDQFILRLDYVESSNSTWAGRYSWGDENESSPGLNQNGTKLVTNLEQYMGTNTRILSPAVVTETRFGYTRFYNSVGTLLAFQRNVVDELAIPGLAGGDPVSWGIPSVGITNYQGIGDSTDGPFENKNSTLQFLNNTSITRGKHSFRFGGEIRRDQFNQVGNQFGRGSFGFTKTPTQDPRALTASLGLPQQGDAFASFLLGNVTLTEVAAQIAAAQFRATNAAFYLDDVWKVTPTLTISMGLRYEISPPWKDISGNLTTVFFNAFDNTPNVADKSRYPIFLRQGKSTGDPYAGLRVRWPNVTLAQDGRLGDRLVAVDNNDFAPRLGIAWSPNSKWSIRTGAGMFYNQDQGNPRFDVARNAAGRTRNDDNPEFPTETWANGAGGLIGSVANILTPQGFSNKCDRRTPYTYQWLFNVQRQLTDGLVFEAGYLGSVSRHLESYRGVSAAVPGPGSNASRSPYPNWGLLVLVENGGRGNYNSLGTKLTKRYSNGLTALVSYTWSKSIDTTSGIRTSNSDTLFSQDGRCMLCDRGLSSFDNSQRLVISGLYDIPVGKGKALRIDNRFADLVVGGWQIGGISTWRAGFPINPGGGCESREHQYRERPSGRHRAERELVESDDRPLVQYGGVRAAAAVSIRQCGEEHDLRAGRIQPGFEPAEELPGEGGARGSVPVGGVQPAEPSDMGVPEHEFQQSDISGRSVDGGQHARDAVRAEVRILMGDMGAGGIGLHRVF